MIEIEDALSLIEKTCVELTNKNVSVSKEVIGAVLSDKVYSGYSLPMYNQSAMDGYAVRFNDTLNFILTKNVVKAGDGSDIFLNKGEAIRVFTGAPIPVNADAVVMQEKTSVYGKVLSVDDDLIIGKNIRYKGEEVSKGDLIFNDGHIINPATIGVLKSLGVFNVNVVKEPRVGVVVTGNELISNKEELTKGKIFDSNSYSLSSFLEEQRIDIINNYQVKDDLERTKDIISRAIKENDIVLIAGGISVGDYDFVRESLEYNEVEEIFYKVKQKPGKPLFFGKTKDTFIFGLPGNPAAALTCSYMYALPLINRLKGYNSIHLKRVKAIALNSFKRKGERAQFLKAFYNNGQVKILDGQQSGMMLSFANSNSLILMSSDKLEIIEGEPLENVILLNY